MNDERDDVEIVSDKTEEVLSSPQDEEILFENDYGDE